MQPLKHFRQTPGLCGPASLKILLSHYGIEKTEAELATLCKTDPNYGTDHAELLEAASTFGFEVESRSSSSVDELREIIKREIPVIVGWWSTDDDHYSVAYDVDDEFVYLVDPELDEPTRKISIPEFEAIWYDFDGPEQRRDEGWMLWFEPKK